MQKVSLLFIAFNKVYLHQVCEHAQMDVGIQTSGRGVIIRITTFYFLFISPVVWYGTAA